MSRLVRLLDPCGYTKEETWTIFSTGMSGLPVIHRKQVNMESPDGDDERRPLLEESDRSADSFNGQYTQQTGWRKYLIELISFVYYIAYDIGDILSYQYMYTYSVNLLNYHPHNQTVNDTNVCYVNESSPDYQLQQRVEQMASSWQLYFSLTTGIPCLFVSVIFGTYSDKLGRRFLIFISIASVSCRGICYAVVDYWSFRIEYMFIGYILEGLGGSFLTMTIGQFAYAADVTDVKGVGRSMKMVIIDGLSGLADGVAFMISGYAIVQLGYASSFLIMIGFFLLTTFLVVCLPESRDGSRMQQMDFLIYLKRSFVFYTGNNPKRYIYIFCLISFLFTSIVGNGGFGIETLYLLNSPFCWGPVRIGIYEAIGHAYQRVAGIVFVRLLLCCLTDELSAAVVILSTSAALALEGFAGTDTLMYIVAGVAIGSSPINVLQRSVMSKVTDADNQGALLAGVQLVDSLCNTVGTVLINLVYKWTLGWMKGAVFLFMAILCVLSAIFFGLARIISKRHEVAATKTVN